MKPIGALAKADEIVRLLAEDGAMSPADLSERLGLPRPSVYRLLEGLSEIGLTEPVHKATTRLSLRWLQLADRARGALGEWSTARACLAELVDRTAQTAFLSVLRGQEAVCVEWVQGRGIDVLVLRPGGSLPLYAGAAGRALLAFGEADVEEYLSTQNLRELTVRTLTDPRALRADAEASRNRGFSLSEGDVTEGISAIGAPVRSADGTVLGVVSIAGLSVDITDNLDRYAEVLLDQALRLGVEAENYLKSL